LSLPLRMMVTVTRRPSGPWRARRRRLGSRALEPALVRGLIRGGLAGQSVVAAQVGAQGGGGVPLEEAGVALVSGRGRGRGARLRVVAEFGAASGQDAENRDQGTQDH
jgi:hypothetical protein